MPVNNETKAGKLSLRIVTQDTQGRIRLRIRARRIEEKNLRFTILRPYVFWVAPSGVFRVLGFAWLAVQLAQGEGQLNTSATS